MERHYYVYMMANRPYGTLYVGVTNDLIRRVWEHKNAFVNGFTERHDLKSLVWYEVHSSSYEAIRREKLIKKWHRDWKVNHVQAMNPAWEDLYAAIAA
ncbi:MAG: GIY-YIG nuclease family protein [Cytophagaceae bacterium]|nr:GIY-YIG nuclease family protein [Gemmatimonadaceae bacterium]